jgi:hypothetical protein
MASCRNSDSMSRKPQCPVTCHGGVIRPPRPGAHSCGTRHFAIGTIGLGEAGRLSDELLALVRRWIELVVRCVTKVRDGIPCRFIEPSSTLQPLPPYRFSKVTDWRDPHDGCMPIPPPPTALGGRDYGRSTTFSVSLEGITETEAAGIQKSANRYCTRASEPHYYRTIVLHACHERLAQKPVILDAPSLLGGPSMSRLSRTRL